MKSSGGSMGRMGLHIGEDWWTFLAAYDDHTPILDISAGSASVSLCIASQQVTQAAVEFGRELARQATRFAAELERLHARQHPDSGDGAPSGEAA